MKASLFNLLLTLDYHCQEGKTSGEIIKYEMLHQADMSFFHVFVEIPWIICKKSSK